MLTRDVTAAKVGFIQDQQVIEELASQCADAPFAVCVHPWVPRRGLQGLDALRGEDRVEGLGVLAVPVAEQETQRLEANAQVGGEVAGLLYRPLRGGVSGHVGEVQAARAVLEEDQRVDPTQAGQVDVDEVAGDDAVGLRGQELVPGRAAPAGSRAYAGGGQDLPERGRSDLMPQLCELALDPAPRADSLWPGAAPAR